MDQKKHLPLPERQRELGQTIGEISRAWRYEINMRLKPYGLNQSMQQVLVQLHRHPDGLMQRDLARKLGIEGPTLVRLLDLLEQKELIARIPSPDDKRRKYSVLTTKAAEQIRIIEKISGELRTVMLEGLSSAEIDSGLQLVRRMRNNLLTD
ncbi:MAG TPA: MarR family transcriptional regulator [Noviherbaspirillum sp.]|jgi:MarR family transcriptional regulator for hemolysin|uniref:MarR family transcriptional regulator n=1 Tax=Noviherbaspirillum sp. TaxID=1926288 RepID=UPI002DDCE3C0|nr:MarR family transcriptional regulator [Noviherbaspirillum sp.]HEV2609304.1 MarR family transcriptional regulator [Noviherbaspirillum sp.]